MQKIREGGESRKQTLARYKREYIARLIIPREIGIGCVNNPTREYTKTGGREESEKKVHARRQKVMLK